MLDRQSELFETNEGPAPNGAALNGGGLNGAGGETGAGEGMAGEGTAGEEAAGAVGVESRGDASRTGDATYRLAVLEVFNWGPFRGLHRAEFDPYGTAIIGPTGSGKTTLVDALMTLLVAQPRYNLASTGGHESDRTLISYVRGVLGGDGSDGQEEVTRAGKTITGIAATYQGGGVTLRLAALLWTEGASNAADDLKRRWLFARGENHNLETWLRQLHEEGVRELMRVGRETADLRIFESKSAYLAHVRKTFDVGENAFTLLNRAAGLKQLNSIDEIFRDLVLDDRSAFERALEVAGEFDNLVGIHTELETARRQQESLAPVAEEHQKLLKARKKAELWRTLKQIVSPWFATIGREKWSETLERIAGERAALESRRQREKEEEETIRARVEVLREKYLKLGGNAIGDLEKAIDAQEKLVVERRRHAEEYLRIAAAFGPAEELSAEGLARNQARARETEESTQKLRAEQWERTLASHARRQEQERQRDEAGAELRKVKERPGSNIPPRQQDFRSELAERLSLGEGDLPFLAELVEVKADQAAWRGAIERAIGSERLRILVPSEQMNVALRWVNDRDNRLHVRLQDAGGAAGVQGVEGAGAFHSDGYTQKLNFKKHPLAEAAKRLLAARDLHCVASAEALRHVEHGLTIEGTISGRHGKFEKQDQRRLDEDWMTGFDNKDQLVALAARLAAAEEGVRRCDADSRSHRDELAKLDSRLAMIAALLALEFSTIDLPGAEGDLARSRERLKELLDPGSDAGQAKKEYDLESDRLKGAEGVVRTTERELAVLEAERRRAEEELRKATFRIGRGLSEEETQLAEKHLAVGGDVAAKDLADAERDNEHLIDKRLDELRSQVEGIEQGLVRLMEGARRVDTGALADVGSDLDDVPHYLERLRVLNEEALPEKRRRFLEYLNRSSDQGVTQLLAGIDEEVDAIEQRIKELNQTLVKVDFRAQRYLQLQPQRIKHERLRTLETAMRKVRSAALKDDEGESHYRALRELVEILREAGGNRRQLGSRALLDPRYRLQFFVVEVDRQTGNQSPPRTGSQSGSGGEKELMASHILTASLSYALCPAGSSRPLYGTVILDEAFSKSSPSAAGRIIEALRIFRLNPIFVTPNKEIGLLKRHTRKVICVQRPGKEAGLASISWEKLEEIAARS